MSLDFYFHVESRQSDGWSCPEAFPAEENRSQNLGEFTWIRGRSPIQTLFFGDRALFRFRRERPPDTRASRLFEYLDRFYDYGFDDRRLSWIPYEELLVDLWDEPGLLVTARVQVAQAVLFGDGRQLFPEQALAAAGWEGFAIRRLREGYPTQEPIDRTFGLGRNEIAAAHDHQLLNVTWVDSVCDYLGQGRAAAFRSLRQYGTDSELRVISLFS